MTHTHRHPRGGFRPGWILASAVLVLCLLGAWLTSRNYRAQVFTSTGATVLQNQWPESRIEARFAPEDLGRIRPGMMARITATGDTALLTGRVLSVGGTADPGAAVIALTGGAGESGGVGMTAPSGKPRHYLQAGETCAVTVDATVPPEALSAPAASPR